MYRWPVTAHVFFLLPGQVGKEPSFTHHQFDRNTPVDIYAHTYIWSFDVFISGRCWIVTSEEDPSWALACIFYSLIFAAGRLNCFSLQGGYAFLPEYKSRFLTPIPGEMIQFDVHMFQMGWFNHQVDHFLVNQPLNFGILWLPMS